MNFVPIFHGANITQALIAIANNDHLFDAVTVRQDYEGTAHSDTKAVILRAPVNFNRYARMGADVEVTRSAREAIDKAVENHKKVLNETNAVDRAFKELECEDRDEYALLPEIRPLVTLLMSHAEGERLGSVSVVKLKPGGLIDEHRDEGPYSEYYDRFHIALVSPSESRLVIDGQRLNMRPGEAWWINHTKLHYAENLSQDPRIHLIVDIKVRSRPKQESAPDDTHVVMRHESDLG